MTPIGTKSGVGYSHQAAGAARVRSHLAANASRTLQAACGTDEVRGGAARGPGNHRTEETHTSSATQVGISSKKPSHCVRCWTNDGHMHVCLGADGSALSEERAELGSFCRQFNIGDTVYVLCKNNNGGEGDINYLQIV